MFEQGSFEQAYRRNRNAATADVIEADMVADAVRSFMREREEWSGTASELRDMLEDVVGEKQAKSKTWPRYPPRFARAATAGAGTVAEDRYRADLRPFKPQARHPDQDRG